MIDISLSIDENFRALCSKVFLPWFHQGFVLRTRAVFLDPQAQLIGAVDEIDRHAIVFILVGWLFPFKFAAQVVVKLTAQGLAQAPGFKRFAIGDVNLEATRRDTLVLLERR